MSSFYLEKETDECTCHSLFPLIESMFFEPPRPRCSLPPPSSPSSRSSPRNSKQRLTASGCLAADPPRALLPPLPLTRPPHRRLRLLPPSAAPVLTAQASEDGVELSWTTVHGATRYELLVWDSVNDWRQIGGDGLTGTTYTHTDPVAGTTYFYIIRAANADGETSAWSDQVSTVTATHTPAATATPTHTPRPHPLIRLHGPTPTVTAHARCRSHPPIHLQTRSTQRFQRSFCGRPAHQPALSAPVLTVSVGHRTRRTRYVLLVTQPLAPDWRRRPDRHNTLTSTSLPAPLTSTPSVQPTPTAKQAHGPTMCPRSHPLIRRGAHLLRLPPAATPTPTPTPTLPADHGHTHTPTPTHGRSTQRFGCRRQRLPPSAPVLTAQAAEDGVELSWTTVHGATRYELFVWDSVNDWRQIGGDSLTGTTYTHTDPAAGTTYFYTIRAANADGETSAWSDYVSTATAMTRRQRHLLTRLRPRRRQPHIHLQPRPVNPAIPVRMTLGQGPLNEGNVVLRPGRSHAKATGPTVTTGLVNATAITFSDVTYACGYYHGSQHHRRHSAGSATATPAPRGSAPCTGTTHIERVKCHSCTPAGGAVPRYAFGPRLCRTPGSQRRSAQRWSRPLAHRRPGFPTLIGTTPPRGTWRRC